MILKTQFTPRSMWPYARIELLLGAAAGFAAWAIVSAAGVHQVELPVTVATVLGTALSILLAVRINTSYQRWWEVSGVWAQIVGLSRNLVRVVVAVSDSKVDVDRARVMAFQADMAHRQIAYVNALRVQLQGRPGRHPVAALVGDAASAQRSGADSPALALLGRQSRRIFEAYQEGILSGLDNFQMEVALAGLGQQQALAERTAAQPTPRTYDVFSRYLVHLYVAVFPFAIIGALPRDLWIVIPATLLVAFAFRMLERIGTVVESPFADTVHDLPLEAICIGIERDLLEQIGETHRPPVPQPVAGYLR